MALILDEKLLSISRSTWHHQPILDIVSPNNNFFFVCYKYKVFVALEMVLFYMFGMSWCSGPNPECYEEITS